MRLDDGTDAVGDDRVQERDEPDDHDGGHQHRLEHRLVVPAADEPPQPLVLAERAEADERHHHDAGDRRPQQALVPLRARAEPAGEAQPEGEEVCERDQKSVHQQLGQRVAVDGKGRGSDPSAHAPPDSSGAPWDVDVPLIAGAGARRYLGIEHALWVPRRRHVQRLQRPRSRWRGRVCGRSGWTSQPLRSRMN